MHKLNLMPSKLIKKYGLLYTVFRGDVERSQGKAIIQWNGVSRRLSKLLYNGNNVVV